MSLTDIDFYRNKLIGIWIDLHEKKVNKPFGIFFTNCHSICKGNTKSLIVKVHYLILEKYVSIAQNILHFIRDIKKQTNESPNPAYDLKVLQSVFF